MLCLSTGEAKSGFPADFFSSKHVISSPRTSHSRGGFLLSMTFTTFGNLAGVLGFVGCDIFCGKRPDYK